MSHDQKCYDLAKAFLADTPAATDDHASDLAETIQQAIEDWFATSAPKEKDELSNCVWAGAEVPFCKTY